MRRRGFLAGGTGVLAAITGCIATGLAGETTTAPGPAEHGCPEPVDGRRFVCQHDSTGPLSVSRSPATVTGSTWSLGVAVTNRTSSTYASLPYAWSIHRQTTGGWRRVIPASSLGAAFELAPGDRYEWVVTADEPHDHAADQAVFVSLETGRYAFVVPFDGPRPQTAVARFTIAA